MPYYRCPGCAFTVQSVAGRFAASTCPRCSLPLEGTDRIYAPQRPPATVSRRFAAKPSAAGAGRRALASLLSGFDPAECQVAALLTTELIANSVEHSGSGPDGSVCLDVALSSERLRVEVADEGPGFVPAPRAPDAPLESHWGLHLVAELADRWGVAAKPEAKVWFELDRPPSALGSTTMPELSAASRSPG
jgi:anti-sigma regulatory factor (Ser/Thr protein kinase)